MKIILFIEELMIFNLIEEILNVVNDQVNDKVNEKVIEEIKDEVNQNDEVRGECVWLSSMYCPNKWPN